MFLIQYPEKYKNTSFLTSIDKHIHTILIHIYIYTYKCVCGLILFLSYLRQIIQGTSGDLKVGKLDEKIFTNEFLIWYPEKNTTSFLTSIDILINKYIHTHTLLWYLPTW